MSLSRLLSSVSFFIRFPAESELFILFFVLFLFFFVEMSETSFSQGGLRSKGYDQILAVIQPGKEGIQPKAIPEDKTGRRASPEKITFITFTG